MSAKPTFLRTAEAKTRFWTFLTLAVLSLIWWQTMRWYRLQLLAEQRVQAAEEVFLRGNALNAAIYRRFALLRGLHAFVRTESFQEDFASKFVIFASDLYSHTSGINNIALAPKGIIQYIYPLEGNHDILGYDLLNPLQADLKEDVHLAIQTEDIILGFPLDYAQGGWGLAARQVVYLENREFWGLISIVIDLPTLLADAGLEMESADFDFSLLDGSGQVIFESSPERGNEKIKYRLSLPDGPWELVAFPKEDWDMIIRPDLLPIQVSGLFIVLLLSGQVYVLVNRQARLASAVQQRTQEIARINRSLEQRVETRTRELTTMLEISQKVATMPDLQPLLSFILDQLQGIVPCVAVSIFLLDSPGELTLLSYQGPLSPEEIPLQWPLEMADHYLHVIQNKRSLVIPNVRTDSPLAAAWQRTTRKQLGKIPDYIAAWLGVPLVVKRKAIGLLVVHHQEVDSFSEEQASLALAFAHQAALAIENARLYEQAQQVAILRERQRLARELHDSVSQALYSIGLGARTAQTLLRRGPQPEDGSPLSEPISHIISLAEGGLAEMRALIFELRPESLEVEGLIAGLTKQAAAVQARHGLRLQVDLGDEPDIPIHTKLLLYRITQEALHNIVKHAQALRGRLELSYHQAGIRLSVQDDGKGFDPQAPSQGLGLRSMQERLEEVKGVLDIKSSPGEGTAILAWVPLEETVETPQ